MKPRIGYSPEEIVDLFPKQETYAPSMPFRLGMDTDAFTNRAVSTYYERLLEVYLERGLPNPLAFVTKKRIPNRILTLAARAPRQILFYLSYSGLAGTPVEPHIRDKDIKDNFVRLHEAGLTAIHYWRPFLPQNSNEERIKHVLDFVASHASCSVVVGLRLNDGIRRRVLPFWPELSRYTKEDMATIAEFWPAGVRARILEYAHASHQTYRMFFINEPCSIAYARNIPDLCGHFGDSACRDSLCPQRTLCATHHKMPTREYTAHMLRACGIDPSTATYAENRIELHGTVRSEIVTYLRYMLRFPVVPQAVDHANGYSFANVGRPRDMIEVPWTDG